MAGLPGIECLSSVHFEMSQHMKMHYFQSFQSIVQGDIMSKRMKFHYIDIINHNDEAKDIDTFIATCSMQQSGE